MSTRPEFAEIDVGMARVLERAGLEVKVVFDIGASNAFWSVQLSKVFPQAAYHLFEPLAGKQESYSGYLRTNLAAYPAFTLHPIALGEREGTVPFWTDAAGFGSSALDVSGVSGFAANTVEMHRLDEYVRNNDLPLPDFIKLDVQGYEDRILRHGARCMRHASALLIETWLYRSYGSGTPLLNEIIDLVGEHGFDLVEIGDRHYGPGHKLVAVDALFLKRDWTGTPNRILPAGDWFYER